MNLKAQILKLGLLCLMWTACSRNELTNKPVTLRFSADTLRFDTVFTAQTTATMRLMVYNPARQAVVTHIRIASGAHFRINVDGAPLQSNCEAEIAADDSMFIFVEANINTQNSDLPVYIVDSLIFNTNERQQTLLIEAFGQDVIRLRNDTLKSTVWSSAKPYLLEGLTVVDTLQCLQIKEGVKVYMGADANLLIKGTLQAEGCAAKPIVIAGARTEDYYHGRAGLWGSLQLQTASRDNLLRHVELRGGINGLIIGKAGTTARPYVALEAVAIQYMSYSSLIAYAADIDAANCLMTDCGDIVVALYGCGNANFTHCTLANGFSPTIYRRADHILSVQPYKQPMSADILPVFNACNCIISGNENNELNMSDETNYTIRNCLINSALQTLPESYINNIVNKSPCFVKPETGNYSLAAKSPACNAADPLCSASVQYDFLGNDRLADGKPDIGAMETMKQAK